MKNSSKYIFILSILFFNSTVNASKLFKEDFDQEKGLIILNKLYDSFNNFEISFNNHKTSGWKDQFNTLSISRNRIETALRSAELTKKLEEKWDGKDRETLSPRKIQKVVWENSQIHSIPYLLNLFERGNPFDDELWNIEQESSQILQKNSEELAKIMEEKGDREEKEEARVYFKYKKLKENRIVEIQENNSNEYLKDTDYQKFHSAQMTSLAKLKEISNISDTSDIKKLSTNCIYKNIYDNLINQKFPLPEEFKQLQKLADEMVKIYFN